MWVCFLLSVMANATHGKRHKECEGCLAMGTTIDKRAYRKVIETVLIPWLHENARDSHTRHQIENVLQWSIDMLYPESDPLLRPAVDASKVDISKPVRNPIKSFT